MAANDSSATNGVARFEHITRTPPPLSGPKNIFCELVKLRAFIDIAKTLTCHLSPSVANIREHVIQK